MLRGTGARGVFWRGTVPQQPGGIPRISTNSSLPSLSASASGGLTGTTSPGPRPKQQDLQVRVAAVLDSQAFFCSVCALPVVERYRTLPCYHYACAHCIEDMIEAGSCTVCSEKLDSWERLDDRCELHFCPARSCLRCFLSPPALEFHKKQHILEKQLTIIDTSVGTSQPSDLKDLGRIIKSLEAVKFKTWDAYCKGMSGIQQSAPQKAAAYPLLHGDASRDVIISQGHGTRESHSYVHQSQKDPDSHHQLSEQCDTAAQEEHCSLPDINMLTEDGRVDTHVALGESQASPRRLSHVVAHMNADQSEKAGHLPEPCLEQSHLVAPSDPVSAGQGPQSATCVHDAGSSLGSASISNAPLTGSSVETKQLNWSVAGTRGPLAAAPYLKACAQVPAPSTQPIQQQQVQDDDDDNLDEFL